MHTVVQTIQKKIAGADFEDKSKLFQLILAEAMALSTPIPCEPCEEPASFFRTNYKLRIMTDLSKVNEYIVIDLEDTANLIYKLWLTRYELVHKTNDVGIGRLLGFILASGKTQIPPNYSELINKYPKLYFSRYEIADNEELNQ